MKKKPVTFRERIDACRNENGEKISVEKIAREMGVALNTLFRWLRNNNIPKKSMRIKFENILAKHGRKFEENSHEKY